MRIKKLKYPIINTTTLIMKKILSIMAAIAVVCCMALTSCSKSTPDLINDYRDLCKEAAAAVEKGDIVKLATISEKGAKIEKELNNRELTPEEKEELVKISADFAKALANKATGNASDSSEE